MKSLENPEVIKIFMNGVLKIYTSIMNPIIVLIIVVIVVSYVISLVVSTESKLTGKFNLKNLKEHFNVWKKDIKQRFTKEKVVNISKNRFLKIKPYLWKCRYLIVGYILSRLAWYFVALAFWYTNSKIWLEPGTLCFAGENQLMGLRSLYSLLFFLVAPMFITFCFGNKFVLNIGVLIYILGIIFVLLGAFLKLGCPVI